MAGTFPTSPAPRQIRLSSIEPAYVSTAHSLRKITRSRGVQRWGITLAFPPMIRDDWAPIIAFVMKQKGQAEKFDIVLPKLSTPRGNTGTDNPTVNGIQSAGIETVNIKDMSNLIIGFLKAGDFIRFASHAKSYMVMDDMNSDSSGTGSVNIRPPLMEDLANNEAITVRSVPFQVTFTNNTFENILDVNNVYGINAELVETI